MSVTRALGLIVLVTLAPLAAAESQPSDEPPPIIDVHLHAVPADYMGTIPVTVCVGDSIVWSPMEVHGDEPRRGDGNAFYGMEECAKPIVGAKTDDELLEETIAVLERFNIQAVTSGSSEFVERWHERSPERIIRGFELGGLSGRTSAGHYVSPAELRRRIESGATQVLAEVVTQYEGMSPTDPLLEPYFALAEELSIPVGLHMGLGGPGTAYTGLPEYRAGLTNPFLLEEVLLRHPELRIYVMHAGWPMVDEMIHLLYSHPQLYVGLGAINWAIPRREFHYFLRRLVDAGFGKRIMFGSDQMVWPETISVALDAIDSASFLTHEQKRDILYNNAYRFFRLGDTAKTGDGQ